MWGVPEAAIDAACRHEDSGVDAELSETTFIVRLANLAADAARDGGESEELTAARAEAARRGWTSALPALDAQVPASTH